METQEIVNLAIISAIAVLECPMETEDKLKTLYGYLDNQHTWRLSKDLRALLEVNESELPEPYIKAVKAHLDK